MRNEWDALTKKEMWDEIQKIRIISENDGTQSPASSVQDMADRIATLEAELFQVKAQNYKLIDDCEKEEARAEKAEALVRESLETLHEVRRWFIPIVCQCDSEVNYKCERCCLVDTMTATLNKIKEAGL